jgi:hypothetical protein
MRIVRLVGVILTMLTAGLLLATPAGAQPPSKLTDHITDSTGVLTDSGRAAVNSAIDRLLPRSAGAVGERVPGADGAYALTVLRAARNHLDPLGL